MEPTWWKFCLFIERGSVYMLGRELSKELVLGAGEQIKQLLSHKDEEI
jgi:hypothetical protein